LSNDRLKKIIDLTSKFIEKYRNHPSIEGIVLFGSQVVGAIDEQSDIDLLFVLSDSLLPKIEEVLRKDGWTAPAVGLWYEWGILDDKTLPTTQYYTLDGKTIDCLFATVQMIRNSVDKHSPSLYHSLFQEGIIVYDREDTVAKLSKEILSSIENILENQRKKNYEAFNDLLQSLERFINQDDMASAEVISVECYKAFLDFMFAQRKQVSRYYKPQTLKRIMLDARKYLPPEIVSQIETLLVTHDLSERLKLLKKLQHLSKDNIVKGEP